MGKNYYAKKPWDGKVTGVGFWTKESGNHTSMTLTDADVEYLHSLQAGDRLNLFTQEKGDNPKSPNFVLRRFWRNGEVMPNGQIYEDRYVDKRSQSTSEAEGI